MSQKGFPNFSNSGQNAKEIFNTSQKGQPTLEKRFQEEFPPLVSDGKDDLPTQIAVENFLNRSPLEALAGTENTTGMLSQQSLRQNKQDSNFSLKNEALTGQYKNEFAFFSLNQRPPLKEKSASPQQSGEASKFFDQIQNANSKGSPDKWDMITHTLKLLPEGMNDSSDFFDFSKGQVFGQINVPQSKGSASLEKQLDPEFEMIIPMVEKFNSECNIPDEQEDEEEPQPWLIPAINKELSSHSQSTLGVQNKAFINSGAKRSNGSFMSNESTIDSDQLMNHDLINTSLSANSNSKSNETNTPTKMDSFRKSQQNAFTGGQITYMPWMQQQFNSNPQALQGMMPSGFNQGGLPPNLNYSGNEALGTEDPSFWGVAQGYQQQQLMNQGGYAFYNGYMDQMQFYHPAFINQGMILPQYMNQGANIAYNQRQGGSQQKLKGRNQKKIPENEESSQYYDVILENLKTDPRTTLMIKNIPNKYDQPLLLQAINKNHQDKFDFFYLPIDFKNKCNVGYAFINFCDTSYIKDFYEEFNGKKWNKFNSEKICRIKYGRIQGLEALVQHFEASSVMNQQDKKLKPLILTKNSKNSKNGNIFPKRDLQNIEQLVRHQKAKIGVEGKAKQC